MGLGKITSSFGTWKNAELFHVYRLRVLEKFRAPYLYRGCEQSMRVIISALRLGKILGSFLQIGARAWNNFKPLLYRELVSDTLVKARSDWKHDLYFLAGSWNLNNKCCYNVPICWRWLIYFTIYGVPVVVVNIAVEITTIARWKRKVYNLAFRVQTTRAKNILFVVVFFIDSWARDANYNESEN